jgi:hypothetical protein
MCNCKKQPRVEIPYPTIPEVTMVPEPTPVMIITERATTEEEQKIIDEFDNLDEFFNQ